MIKQVQSIEFHVEKTIIGRPKAWIVVSRQEDLAGAKQFAMWMREHIEAHGLGSKVRIRKAKTVTTFEVVEEDED